MLGAGGTVGLAYHCGVLHALAEVGGVRADDAELIVGTSAGSVIGAYLRSGWTTDDLWQFALGIHPTLASMSPDELEGRQRALFVPAWATPRELARRGVGSAYVLARSVVRGPQIPIPASLRRRFPGGLFAMAEGERRFADELPEEWPDRPLWLCAVDISSGRRVVLGRAGSPRVGLREAVMASCAIPGVYKPVRIGGKTLVDGGARSTTNLDLASKAGLRPHHRRGADGLRPCSSSRPVAAAHTTGADEVARGRGARGHDGTAPTCCSYGPPAPSWDCTARTSCAPTRAKRSHAPPTR